MTRILLLALFLLAPSIAHAAPPSVSIFCPTGNAAPNDWAACTSANTFPVALASQYPTGSTPITGNSTGTTGAVVGTLTAVSAKTTYICGMSVTATGGTGAVGPITVAGTITASLVFELNSSVSGTSLYVNFSPCIPASATNTNITTTTTADGTASAVAVNSWGFNQ